MISNCYYTLLHKKEKVSKKINIFIPCVSVNLYAHLSIFFFLLQIKRIRKK